MRNAIIKKFEELGFTVDKDKKGYQVQQYTPASQDWSLYFKDLQDIEDFAVNFNPYEENEILLENKHSFTISPNRRLYIQEVTK